MKILTIGNFTTGWDGSICDEEHIAGALESLGHEVQRQQREERVYVEDFAPDVVLIAQWDGYAPDLLARIRRFSGGFIVYWAFDYQADGQEWHEKLVEGSDLYLSKRLADRKYSNWQWLSQDFSPDFLDKYPGEVDQDIDVLFTGTYLSWADERNKTLKAIDEKYNLTIHSLNPAEWMSAGFKRVNGPVMDDRLPQLIARAKINISIDHTLEMGYWSDRNAQIMCCGGLVLFRYVGLSEARFGNYIDYFYDTEGCMKKIDYLLDNTSHREHRANRGYEYAQANLTVLERVKDLLTIIGTYV